MTIRFHIHEDGRRTIVGDDAAFSLTPNDLDKERWNLAREIERLSAIIAEMRKNQPNGGDDESSN